MSVVPFPDPQGKDSSEHDESASWPSDGAAAFVGAKMSFLDHLDELRKRLIYAALSLCVGIAISCFFLEQVYQFVMRPMQEMLPPGGRLIYTDAPEAFMLYIRLAIIAGLVVAAPLIMLQLWLFISPALYERERRFAIPFVALASIGFIGGAAFSHYVVFPVMWKFFVGFSNDFVVFMPRIEDGFGLYIKMLVGMALVFQMPTIVFFLAKFGLVTAKMMTSYFKYAILAIFVIAAFITPSPDMASQCLVAVPMIGLYVISIGVAWLFGKKREREAEN